MLSFILNIPYTAVGILMAFFLVPAKVVWHKKPYCLIFRVKRYTFGLDFKKKWRGATVGHVVILNPFEEPKDFDHEIIHVKQYERMPVIFPFLYCYELLKNGYRKNKFEDEAYSLAGNIYRNGKN